MEAKMTGTKKMVLIKWYDAKIYPGMHELDEALKREMDAFESLGYLVDRNKVVTRIAHEVTLKGDFRDILLIPSGSIQLIQGLAVADDIQRCKKKRD
jgi:hypothetical protein